MNEMEREDRLVSFFRKKVDLDTKLDYTGLKKLIDTNPKTITMD